MGRVAVGGGFIHQSLALHDAEAVLFVDGDEAEARELDVVFDERVGADCELGFAGTDAFEGSRFLRGFQAADEQLDTVATTFEDAACGKKVLDGENFRRRHESSLATVFNRNYGGLQRDDSFTTADVALQQAVHGGGLFQIGRDFGEDALLCGGGLEREDTFESIADALFAEPEGDGVFFPGGEPVERQAELEEKEFLEDQTLLCGGAEFIQGVDRFFGGRKVRLRQGLKARRIAKPVTQIFGQNVWDTRVEILQRGIDGAANGARAEGGDAFVDGNDAADFGGIDFLLRGRLVAFVRGGGMIDAAKQLDLRIDHFDARRAHLVDFGFAVENEELALLEAPFEVAAVEKFAGELAGGILHKEVVDRVASAHGAQGLAAHDASANGVDAVGLNVLDIGEMHAVFVAERQIEKKIVERIDAAFSEEFGALGPDAFDHADFGGQGERHRCVIYTIGAKVA